jgi:hypothetical protein
VVIHDIGILQGRLSPPQGKAMQFFPQDWAAEFPLAKKLGFSSLTWFLDRNIPAFDPIRDVWLNKEILAQIDEARTIVPIQALDSSHQYPWFGPEASATIDAFELLLPTLVPRLTGSIILPLLLHNAPHANEEKEQTRNTLVQLLELGAPFNACFALESEMHAQELADFVDSFNNPRLGVCYDLGSATAYGFDTPTELRMLGKRIFEVHIKDHKRGHIIGTNPSVKLGDGDADFIGCFEALQAIGYTGGVTLQAWRGVDYLADAVEQLAFINTQ